MRPERRMEGQVEGRRSHQMGRLDLILETLGSHRRFLNPVMEVEVTSRAREAVGLGVT